MSSVGSILPADLLLMTGLVLGAFLASNLALTLGMSVWMVMAARRDERLRSRLRGRVWEFVDDGAAEPAWLTDLTAAERSVLRELLGDQIRIVRGPERERLERLGVALGLDEWATGLLRSGSYHQQLRGLAWLNRLQAEVDPELVVEHCRGRPGTRAAGARVLLTLDTAAGRERATELLFEGGEPFTTLGVDTLYRLHEAAPERLLRYAEDHSPRWHDSVITSTLVVIGESATMGSDVPLTWVFEMTEHGSPFVRGAAVTALEDNLWRTDVRESVAWERLIRDPSVRVRRAAYHVLLSLEDETLRGNLFDAVLDEPDRRTREIFTAALDWSTTAEPHVGDHAVPVQFALPTFDWSWGFFGDARHVT